MPFGPYKDFDACVGANKDKSSPEGYCASIHKKVTGEWPGEVKMDPEILVKWDQGDANMWGGKRPDFGAPQEKKLKPGTIKKALDFVSKRG